jgi:NAD(P)-dependent dehydrogenase (short-subunit alcohol dehydrogenase family)
MFGVKRVVVTGASRGIGLELCRLLMRAGGFEVVGTSRAWHYHRGALGELRELAASTQAGGGLRPSSFSALDLDLADAGSRLGFPLALAGALRNSKLNVLVNNAGYYPSRPGAWDAATFRTVMEVNALAPLRLAEELRQQCVADDFHAVAVTSGLGRLSALRAPYSAALPACQSVADLAAVPFVEDYLSSSASSSSSSSAPPPVAPLYGLSKAALNRGTRLLAEAWGSAARASAVDPGWCSTAMGGPTAPRSPREGALSILAIILGSVDTVGTGGVFTSKGVRVDP